MLEDEADFNKSGIIKLYFDHKYEQEATIIDYVSSSKNFNYVEAVKLDDYFYSEARVDLIKMDM